MKRTPRLLRNGLVAAAGLAFFVAAMGMPLPVGRKKDRSTPFPCMDRTCGCHDAAGCKAHCCCFSSEEKLAWAAKHQVDPTPFVDDAALERIQSSGFRVPEREQVRCCKTKNAACCAKDDVTVRGPTDTTASIDEGTSPAVRAVRRHHSQPSDDMISIAAYRQCTGFQPLWTLLHAAVPPPESVRFELELLTNGRVAEQSPSLTTVSSSPATPPPRT